MKRPSFQFYPADWTGNSNLRRCTHTEKGIWLDVMCLMHDSEEYGVLRWSLKEIAQAVGCTLNAVKGLIAKGVLKGSDRHLDESYIYTPRSGRKDGAPVTLIDTQDGPIWYSSRMVRDEYVRTIRGESSRFGEPNDVSPKHAPKPPFGDGSTSYSSSSPSVTTSVPIGTGADAPPVDQVAEMKKELWRSGKALFAARDIDGEKAGKILGQLLNEYSVETVLGAVRAGVTAETPDPTGYLKACCQRAAGERAKVQKQSRHSGFDQTDYSEGVTEDGRIA